MRLKTWEFYEKREYLIKAIFVFLCFTLFFTWAFAQPFDSCPDEKMRYAMPEYIYKHWALPNANDTSIIDPRYGFSYAANPMLPYMISAVFMKIASFFSASSFVLLMAARMTSILAGVGYVIFVMKISKLAFRKISTQWIFITLCSIWPQGVFVFTYVNCDGLAMFSVAMVIYFWFRAFKNGWDFKGCLGLAVGISIGILSYLNVYIFAVLSFFLFICYYLFAEKKEKRLSGFFKYGFLILGLVLLFTGWHFIRNAVLYNGNLFARGVNHYGELYGTEALKPSVRAANARAILSTLDGNLHWLSATLKGFVGIFGYMTIFLHAWMYLIFVFEFFAGAVGLAVVLVQKKLRIFNRKYILPMFMLAAAVLPFLQAYIFSFSDYQPQGRYAIPALIPVCFFLTIGLSKVCSMVSGKIKVPVWPLILLVNGIVILLSLLLIFKAY